jgi:hypothetical protein
MGDPAGAYRRRIRTVTLEPGTVWGGLEDDFHHFEVTVRHDGAVVTDLVMEARRWPWATCPEAGEPLRSLIGMELSERCTAVAAVMDPRQCCTHQFDLAGLCVSHAARGTEINQYDIELTPPEERSPERPRSAEAEAIRRGEWVARPKLWQKGALVLEFELAVGRSRTRDLLGPEPFTAAPWRGGFIAWADQNLPAEEAERAIVLRRSCDIGMGRSMDLEAIPVALELGPIMTGVCYAMQPENMPRGVRNRGSIRDFARHPDALLAGRPGEGVTGRPG